MTPIYTAELAPASSHGSLVSLPEIFINFGILLGYIVSFCISGLPAYLSWCLMLGARSVQALCLWFVLDFQFCWCQNLPTGLWHKTALRKLSMCYWRHCRTKQRQAPTLSRSWDLQALPGLLHWMEHSQNLSGMVHAAILPCMWYNSRILLLFLLFLMFYLFLEFRAEEEGFFWWWN
jgi:hypothetical protein